MQLTWAPDVIRSLGIKVVVLDCFTARTHGDYPGQVRVVWHHDGSPVGDSPGALDWMVANWDEASANIWVDRYGTWYFVGAGVSWHAGRVLPGMPDNFSSLGIETDHTTGEDWPAAQIDSLRRGTTALLARQGVGPDWLHFHKTICSPAGRKSDPDGLDLGAERARIAALIAGPAPAKPSTTPSTTTPAKDDEVTKEQADRIEAKLDQLLDPNNGVVKNTAVVRANSRAFIDGQATFSNSLAVALAAIGKATGAKMPGIILAKL